MTALAERVTFAIPPDGRFAIVIDGHRYDLTGREPYRTRDGSEAELLVWSTVCAECGAPFVCRSVPSRIPESKRCQEHKRPGVKVDPERRKRIEAAAGGSC